MVKNFLAKETIKRKIGGGDDRDKKRQRVENVITPPTLNHEWREINKTNPELRKGGGWDYRKINEELYQKHGEEQYNESIKICKKVESQDKILFFNFKSHNVVLHI